MPKWLWVSFRALLLLALGVSSALFVDYTHSAVSYCGEGSGCAQVRESGYGYFELGPYSVPLPLVGMLGFSALFLATLLSNREFRRKVVRVLAIVGGFAALLLLGVQAVLIQRFCLLCVIVDVTAIALGLLAIVFLGKPEPEGRVDALALAPWAWVALAALSMAVLPFWPAVKRGPDVPPAIARHYEPGKVTVLEFVDFQCPHCRKLHQVLKPLVERERVTVVRKHLPLRSHQHANFAARVGICAEGKPYHDPLIDFLFTTPDLSESAIRKQAKMLAADVAALDACVASDRVRERLARDRQLFDQAGLRGLPTTFIGSWQHAGVASHEAYEEAIVRARQGLGDRGLGAPAYIGAVLLVALFVVAIGRLRAPAR